MRPQGGKGEMSVNDNIFYYLITAFCGVMDFFVKRLIEDLDSLGKEHTKSDEFFRKEIASIRDNYMKYEDFVRFQSSIDSKLTKIYEILVGRPL